MLITANWELVTDCTDVNSAYNTFLTIFSRLYNNAFPKYEVDMKSKSLKTPCLLKFSKRKQRLYKNFLKNKNRKNESNTKSIRIPLQMLKVMQEKHGTP